MVARSVEKRKYSFKGEEKEKALGECQEQHTVCEEAELRDSQEAAVLHPGELPAYQKAHIGPTHHLGEGQIPLRPVHTEQCAANLSRACAISRLNKNQSQYTEEKIGLAR